MRAHVRALLAVVVAAAALACRHAPQQQPPRKDAHVVLTPVSGTLIAPAKE